MLVGGDDGDFVEVVEDTERRRGKWRRTRRESPICVGGERGMVGGGEVGGDNEGRGEGAMRPARVSIVAV